MNADTATSFAEIDANTDYDLADRIDEIMTDRLRAGHVESYTPSSIGRLSGMSTQQAARGLAILVRLGTATDTAGRGGAWTRYSLTSRAAALRSAR